MLRFHRMGSAIRVDNFIWIGIATGIFYWVLESFFHVLFFDGTSIIEELITPDTHETWKRILVVSLLILFGVFAQQYFKLRKRSENALKESEKKYRTIFEEALNPIFLFDDSGQFIDSNHAALDFLECTQNELLEKSFRQIALGRSPNEYLESVSTTNGRWILENDYLVKNRTKTMLLNLVPLSGGAKSLIYGIGQDISERKQMERTLKQAHAELDQIFQTASVGMRVVDNDHNVIKINKTFASMAGLTEDEAINKKCYDIFSGPMCRTADCPITRILKGEPRFETYVDKQRRDGKIISSILTATPFTSSDGDTVGIVESFRDITELKKANNIIHSERDKLQRILSHLQEGVSIVRTDYTIEYQNDVLMENLGDCRGKTCHGVFMGKRRPCAPCLMQVAIQSGRVQHVEYETNQGRCFEQAYTRITDIDGEDKAVVLLRDVTEQKANLRAAMHAERLAAVGELAAGVAHEINNPINGIINYAQIISNKSEPGNMVNDVAARIVKEGDRIARIVAGLLSFARRRHEEKTIISVKDILSDALTLTTAQMRKDNINVKITLTEDISQIFAQPNEIEQVFINLISNARHALNEKYPQPHEDKILEISSEPIDDNHRQYVRISFHDHGTGIPASVIDRVKSPFFSTKSDGKRTGLGLSISHGIVENHKGRLIIESVQGHFTRINIDLPRWRETLNSRNAA